MGNLLGMVSIPLAEKALRVSCRFIVKLAASNRLPPKYDAIADRFAIAAQDLLDLLAELDPESPAPPAGPEDPNVLPFKVAG